MGRRVAEDRIIRREGDRRIVGRQRDLHIEFDPESLEDGPYPLLLELLLAQRR